MSTMLTVSNLSKSFGENTILSNINFEIKSGDIVGLIGKNGSGKTTLMKMILGFIPITDGEILFQGDSNYFSHKKMLSKIGFLLDCKLFDDFTGYDNLKLFSMYAPKHQTRNIDQDIKNLLEFVGLENNKKIVKSYSFGMKQRLGLALALLDNPEFLILDEPFVGLDPVGVRTLLDYIKKLRDEKGVTVLISSHQLHEIEEICDYFLFVNEKKIEVHKGVADYQLTITIEKMSQELRTCLTTLVDVNQNTIKILNDTRLLNEILKTIYSLHGEIQSIQIEPTIEELFRR